MPNRLSRFADGVMEACWLLALIVAPLFFNIFSSRVFEPDKISLVRSLALVTLAAWLIKLISEGGPRYEAVRSNFASLGGMLRVPLVLPVAGLVLIYLVSTIFSVAPHASLFGSYQRLQGTFTTFSYLVLFAAVAANLRRRAQVERLLTTVTVTSLPVGLYGILQHYRLDPLPWGGDTTIRVTANMGNAIFISAYLIMSAMVGLGRVVTAFHAILTEEDTQRLPYNVARAALYIFIVAVNLVTIFWSGSRGPWLGLLAGLFLFFLLLSLHWRARAVTLTTVGLAALAAVFLVVLNIPGGPLEPLRALPGVGRLGEVFETEGGTGRVRVLIWSGVIDLMTPHAPLEFPDGSVDRWNVLRPLIGYGPEALYVAFNPFYPPELAQLEARNASPDRSHNETFDALAFTGLLGLVVYLALFTAIFYYGLKWLGLVTTPARRAALLGLILGGGLVSGVGFIIWQGPEFFGVGLPFGMLLGLIVYQTLVALIGQPRPASEGGEAASGVVATAKSGGGLLGAPETWRAVAIISLLGAIVAHFTEIHFGIAIVSSRTHFWVFTGLLFVLGFVLPATATGAEAAVDPAAARARRRGRAPAARAGGDNQLARDEWAPVLISGLITTAILITLGFDFLNNPNRSADAGQIMVDAFTWLPTPEPGRRSLAVLGMVVLSWLGGGALSLMEEPQSARNRNVAANLAASWGVALLFSLVAWVFMSAHLASVARITVQDLNDLLATASGVAGTISLYYTLMFLVVLGLGAGLALGAPALSAFRSGRARGQGNRSPLAIVGYVTLPVLAVLLSFFLNVQIIQADVIYKTALQFDDSGQPQAAIPLYERALALAPGEDYYYLFLGRAYLNATSGQTDPAQVEALLARAEEQLHAARLLNPLNTDHTANLARLNRRWAELTSDPANRTQHAQLSSDYYAGAVALSPNNAGLWNEWAALALQVLEDPDAAQQHLDQSFALDTKFDQTYQLQGDLYAWRAARETDPEQQAEWYRLASDVYVQGIALAEERDQNPNQMRVSLASVYAATGEPALAIEQYNLLLLSGDSSINQWQVHRAISELYAQMGDLAQARSHAELALQLAPENDRASVQAWLDSLP